ncbi:MAG: regulator of sigma protease [Gaiellaceae bacterium]|jgi:regulator of sigma E protease|nr:regulator of sigma protease [Gaiellaceae bacterium]
MSVFISILGLGFLILIHEAGHFFVARVVGMNPRKFYLGFPPALVKAKRKGIEYGIGAIPLGGYVKIPGMHRPAAGDLDMHFGRAVEEQPSLRRPLDALRERLEESDYTGAREAVTRLAEALQEANVSAAAAKSAERGLGDIEDALAPDAYWRAKTWKRVAVIFAGPGANLLLAVVLFTLLFMVGGGKATRTVDEVVAGTPAAAMGLKPGDTIVAIEGTPVGPNDIAPTISSSKGRPLTVTVERDGKRIELGPTKPEKTNGAYRLGFVLAGEGLGPVDSTWQAIRVTGIVTKEIGGSVGRLVTGEGRKEISSPVGIVQGSSQAIDQGYDTYLWVLGLISLSLALLNLLPLLPLDGGHIAFSIVEGIRGKAVAREVYERVSAVGIALVLLLFFIGLSNDIGRLGN